MRITREDKVVVRQMFIALLQPEIQHHAGACRLITALVLELARSRRIRQQLAMRAHRVLITHDGVKHVRIAHRRRQAGHSSVFLACSQYLRHIGAHVEAHAKLRRQLHHSLRHGARSAHRIPDTLFHLHGADRGQNRRRCVRAGAYILHHVVQHLRRVGVGDELADGSGHGLTHAHLQHIAQHLDVEDAAHIERVLDRTNGLPEEELIADGMQLTRQRHQLLVSAAHAGKACLQAGGHRRLIIQQINRRAIVEEAAPLRVQPHHVDVVVQVLACLRKDLAQHRRLNQDRRPHIEPEALFAQLRCLTAQPGVLLKDLHLMPACRQRTSRREPC